MRASECPLAGYAASWNRFDGKLGCRGGDRVRKLIIEDIPNCITADAAYRNAQQNSDKQNTRIEHDKALARVMIETCSSTSAAQRVTVKRWNMPFL